MEKNITVKEIVENWLKRDDRLKDDYLNEVLEIRDYVPYAEKINLCEKIVELSSWERNADGLRVKPRISKISRHIWYVIYLVDVYTNLSIDYANIFEDYDRLAKDDFLSQILLRINIRELNAFEEVLNMATDDFVNRYLSIQGQVDQLMNNLKKIISEYALPLLNGFDNKDENQD